MATLARQGHRRRFLVSRTVGNGRRRGLALSIVMTLILPALLAVAPATARDTTDEATRLSSEPDEEEAPPEEWEGEDSVQVDRASLVPADGGNTVHTLQAISFRMRSSNPMASRLVRVVVEDNLGAVLAQLPITTALGVGDTALASTLPVALTGTGPFTARITTLDLDGSVNTVTEWVFRRIVVTAESTTASSEQAEGLHRTDNTWQLIPSIKIRPFGVHSTATQHSGFGSIGQRIPLGGAYVEYEIEVDGEVQRKQQDVYSADHAVVAYKHYAKAKREGASEASMTGQTVFLEPVDVELPEGAGNPVFKLDPVVTRPVVPAADCDSTREFPRACSVDPFPFYLDNTFAEEVLDLGIEFTGTEQVLGETPVFLTQLMGPVEPDLVRLPDEWKARWQPIVLDQGIVATDVDEYVMSFLEGVLYGGNLWPYAPSQYTQACALGFPCTQFAAAAMAPDEVRKRCMTVDGRDREDVAYWQNHMEACRQFNVTQFLAAAKPKNRPGTPTYEFVYVVTSQIGYNDNYRKHPPREEIGIGWNDGGGWQMAPQQYDAFELVGFDVYWCDGSEQQETYDDNPVYRYYYDFKSGYSPWLEINPYGIAGTMTWQWMNRTTFYNNPSDPYRSCTYYNTYEWLYPRTRPAIARARTHLVSVYAATNRSQFEGTAIGTFGHKWSEWDYSWELFATFACGFGGCKPQVGPSFRFNPEGREHSVEIQHHVTYEHGY